MNSPGPCQPARGWAWRAWHELGRWERLFLWYRSAQSLSCVQSVRFQGSRLKLEFSTRVLCLFFALRRRVEWEAAPRCREELLLGRRAVPRPLRPPQPQAPAPALGVADPERKGGQGSRKKLKLVYVRRGVDDFSCL